MTAWATDAGNSSGAGGVGIVVDNTIGPYNFVAVGLLHNTAVASYDANFTLRSTDAAGSGWSFSLFTADIPPATATTWYIDTSFVSSERTAFVSVQFETDSTGSLYELNAVHAVNLGVESTQAVSKSYPSAAGWPFVMAAMTGSNPPEEVDFFNLARGIPAGTEALLLYEPDECAGFPATYPFVRDLGSGESFRYLAFVDMAGTSVTERPPGCTVPVSLPWTVGRVSWGSRGAWH